MTALHVSAWLLTAAGFYMAGGYGYRRFRSWLETQRVRQEFAAITFDLHLDADLRTRFRELNKQLGRYFDLSTAGRALAGAAPGIPTEETRHVQRRGHERDRRQEDHRHPHG